MNIKNRFFAMAFFAISMTLGACSTAPNMDEVIKDTEINAPAPSNNDGQTDGGGDLPTPPPGV